jgi:hypothetical protein
MLQIHEIIKTAALCITAGCAAYSTYMVHRVVEDGRWVHVISPQDTGRLDRVPMVVQVANPILDVRMSGSLFINDTVPLKVQTVGPVETSPFVTITNRAPLKVEIADTPVPARSVR